MFKKIIIILGVIILLGLSFFAYYSFQKTASEKKINTYISEYGIPSDKIKETDFNFSPKQSLSFTKTVKMSDDSENTYYFNYDLKSKKVTFYATVYGNAVDLNDSLSSKLKYQPSEKVKNMER